MIKALIDGDYLLYTAGFAAERTRYMYHTGDIAIYLGNNVTEIKNQLKEHSIEFEPERLWHRTEVDSEDAAKGVIDGMISQIILAIEKKFGEEVMFAIMIDGEGNFRNNLATIKPYKGLRKPNSKPVLYQALANHLTLTYGAAHVYDVETDDALAIQQTEARSRREKTIIVAVDKDMLQVPGWHYNPNKGFRKVTPEEGMLTLYRQAATGDAVDSIGGCFRCGPKMADEALKEGMSEQKMWDTLVELYQGSIDSYGDQIYKGLDAYAAALENMRLVYLLRENAGPLWLPPHERGGA